MNLQIKKELEKIFITTKSYEGCKRVLMFHSLTSKEYENWIKYICDRLKI